MDKKVLIFSIVAIALVSAGAVTAISMNYEPNMKTASFDGIKVKVPENAQFVKTAGGFEDTNKGISIQTFKNSEGAANYLKTVQGAQVISVANLPANSVAFKLNDMTYIFVTNGKEAIAIGAYDQNLDVKMANSVIFNDGKKTKVDHGFHGIGKKVPNPDVDFNFILNMTKTVNTDIFNELIVVEAISNSTILTDQYENATDNGANLGMAGLPETTDSYGGDVGQSDVAMEQSGNDYSQNQVSDLSQASDSDNGGDFSNLMGMLDENDDYSSDEGSYASEDGDMESTASSSGDSESADSGSGDSSSSDTQDVLSESECKDIVKDRIPDNYKISKVKHNGDVYEFEIKDSQGKVVGTISVDAKTGDVDEDMD